MPRLRARRLAVLCSAAALFAATEARAACPDDRVVAALAGDMLAGTPTEAPDVTTVADGLCAQGKLVVLLSQHWGGPIGYKAGLTSKAAQDRFGVHEPVRDVMLAGMMRESGARMPAAYGAVPRYEADLVAVVGDPAINKATTPKQVLAHVSAIRPFIELPDLVVKAPKTLNAAKIVAINVGARYGVLGAAIPVRQTEAFLDALGTMTVTVTDQDGAQIATAPGKAILGHPLNAVLWLRDSGVAFKAGDVISLGSFGPPLVPKPGLTAIVTYRGLPDDPSVSVTFE